MIKTNVQDSKLNIESYIALIKNIQMKDKRSKFNLKSKSFIKTSINTSKPIKNCIRLIKPFKEETEYHLPYLSEPRVKFIYRKNAMRKNKLLGDTYASILKRIGDSFARPKNVLPKLFQRHRALDEKVSLPPPLNITKCSAHLVSNSRNAVARCGRSDNDLKRNVYCSAEVDGDRKDGRHRSKKSIVFSNVIKRYLGLNKSYKPLCLEPDSESDSDLETTLTRLNPKFNTSKRYISNACYTQTEA
eukprot:TRINITY_DN1054_c0_g4_i1.p1 TRINITY_DN1054_c0_g4~~TRINITY_DN1054_c0_g4_i1.p1  ORF type:complete len:245 (-),score=33.79 TRINITY_DN1054_c0_g4_i1:81-815(-)